MTVDEKIVSLTEKVEDKKQKLSAVTATIEKKKAVAKSLSGEIESLTKSIFDLEAQRLFSKLKSKGVGIASVIQAVDAGIFDEENCAINSTTIEQEEKSDEIGSSGKTIGNA